MGLDVNAIRFLLDAKQKGVSFERVATIGRQSLHIDAAALATTLGSYGIELSQAEVGSILTGAGGFCEPLLRRLGASEVCSIDVSPYQQATCLHDMNQPLPSALKTRFSVVIDGGSLEHVFNFPQAIANCMTMLGVGGHYLGITPANNFMGHGFYQFSPELFYRVFSPANGFVTERMIVYEDAWPYVWHEVLDPEQLRQRVTLVNRTPTYLLVESVKTDDRTPFTPVPQQSDYVSMWSRHEQAGRMNTAAGNGHAHAPALFSSLRSGVGGLVPPAIKTLYRRMRRGRDPFNPRFFRAVDRRSS